MVLEDLEDLLDEDRREAHRRLVEEQDLGGRHQRPPDGEHLLLTTRQRAGLLELALAQAREQLVDPRVLGREGAAVLARERPHLQVLLDVHPREHPAALGALADAERHDLVRLAAVDPLAAQPDLALARSEEAGDRAQRRGLAGAVGPDQRDDLALIDREADAAQRVDRAVVGVDVLELEEGGHVRLPRPRRGPGTPR